MGTMPSYVKEVDLDEEQRQPERTEETEGNYLNLSLGIAIGLSLGVGIGIAIDSLAAGIGLGLAMGVAMGIVWEYYS